jgi:hypothetical protein
MRHRYCREGEFELGAARTPQTQSGETQDALQGGEQQIDLFAIVTRLRVASIAASAAAASTLPMYLARCRAREVDFPGEQRP